MEFDFQEDDEAPGIKVSPKDPGSPVIGGLEGASELAQIPSRYLASKVFPGKEPDASMFGITPEGVPALRPAISGALSANQLPQALGIPVESALKTGAGIGQYFTSPQGLTEAAAMLTPAAPATALKWGVDVVTGIPHAIKEGYQAYKRGDVQGVSDAAANLAALGFATKHLVAPKPLTRGPLHAPTEISIETGVPREYPQGSPRGQASEAGRGDSIQRATRSEERQAPREISLSKFESVKKAAQDLFPDIEIKEASPNVGIEISADGKTLRLSPTIMDDLGREYGPRANEAFVKLVNQEAVHHRQIKRLGDKYNEVFEKEWEKAPKDIQDLAQKLYGKQFGMEPRHWGAELLRMADEAKNTGDVTESIHKWNPATPENVARLRDWANSRPDLAELFSVEKPGQGILNEVSRMTPGDYFNNAEAWSKESMAGKGLGPARRAEEAAKQFPDVEAWRKAYNDSAAEAQRIKDEIKANPSTMVSRQREMMGAGQKRQFFQEGLKMLEVPD